MAAVCQNSTPSGNYWGGVPVSGGVHQYQQFESTTFPIYHHHHHNQSHHQVQPSPYTSPISFLPYQQQQQQQHQYQQQQQFPQQQQFQQQQQQQYGDNYNGLPTSPPTSYVNYQFHQHHQQHLQHPMFSHQLAGVPISPTLTQSSSMEDLSNTHSSPLMSLNPIHSSSDDSYNSPTLPMKRLFPDDPNHDDLADYDDHDEHTSDDDQDQSAEEHLQEENLKISLAPYIEMILQTPISSIILHLISECLGDQITVKSMLSKIKHLCLEYKIDDVYQRLIQAFIQFDGDVRMVNYLVESGVEESDLEFVKEIELKQSSDMAPKKRERKRESISRGLRSPPNKWTKEESQTLIRLVTENGDKQWKKIAARLGGGKTGAQCAQHWKRVLSPEIKKGSWDESEEETLFALVEKHGQSWKNVAMEIKTRTDIQCRYQYFKATMSRQTPWVQAEIDILTKKVRQLTQIDECNISFQQVAKQLARAKTTKIPRTALECKAKWLELQGGKTTSVPSPISLQLTPNNSNHIMHPYSAPTSFYLQN